MRRCARLATAFLALLTLPPAAAVGAQERGGQAITLHPGAAWVGLEETTYEPTTTLAGQGAFARVPGPGASLEPAALLSHRLTRNGAVGVHATLGTGLRDPGDVLLLGASLDVRRAFLTLGAATTRVEEGADPLDDEIFRGEGDRTLYASLRRERRWGAFFAVSFGILP